MLVGPDGLLGRLTKLVFETGLKAEMSEHLGYEPHDAAGRNSGNSRNGVRPKTVTTEIVLCESGRSRSRCPETATGASSRSWSANANVA